MFVIEVIPLKKTIGIESLSYYSSYEYELGTIITVPIRNKQATGIVTSIKPVSAAKTALRTATFSLKKLEAQPNAKKLPQALVATAKKVGEKVPAHLGSILFALLPPDIRAGLRPYPESPEHKNASDSTPMILNSSYTDRYISYRSHIRQTFAHRGSVLFVVSTSAAIEQAKAELQNGIEKRVITFSSTHTKRQTEASYKAFDDLSQAKLIITTPNFAFLDRHDITTIIIEGSGSTHYTARTRPYLDAREVLKAYARETGRSLILGDSLPLTEDEVKRRDDEYGTFEEHTKRLQLPGTLQIARHPEPGEDQKFSLCTPDLYETIKRTMSGRGRIFLLSARRGIAPLVTCFDCGYIFRCPDSGAPYSLLRTIKNNEEERWFYSSTSGKRVRASDTCPQCSSWRLKEQGIGIQQVQDFVKKEFPQAEILLLDHTTASTHNKAKNIIEQFYKTKKVILLGTSMALPYLSKPIDNTAVISYEATRAIPTWRADETVLSLLLSLREVTLKDMVVQTRNEPDELLGLAAKGLTDQFYDGEIEIRRALGYPPYATFILLTWTGTKVQTQEIETQITTSLKGTEVQCYSEPQSTDQKTVRHGLIRLDRSQYPNPDLVETLRQLPPYIKTEINPARIV